MEKGRRRKNSNRIMIIFIFVFLIVVFVGTFSVSDLFKIKYININGNKTVMKSSIDDVLEKEKNKNIFAINIKHIIKKLKENPYISSVEIIRKLPDKLIVNIKERKVFATLKYGDNYCYIDRNVVLLEELRGKNEDRKDKIIDVKYYISNYKDIDFGSYEKKENFLMIMNTLQKYNVYKNIREINMLNKDKIDIITTQNVKIYIPNNENLDYNVNRVSKILEDFKNRKVSNGFLDLTKNKYAIYKPE